MLIAATEPKLAEEHYQIAIDCDPKSADAFFHYANLLLRSARYPEAIRLYRQALKINPRLEHARENAALAEQRFRQQSGAARP